MTTSLLRGSVWSIVITLAALYATTGIVGAQPEEEETQENPRPGMSKLTAIEVCKPEGEQKYLKRLRCSNGRKPKFRRAGSVGSRTPIPDGGLEVAMRQMMEGRVRPGEADLHVVDLFEVSCAKETFMIFLDMHHCPEPKHHEVPPGFTIK